MLKAQVGATDPSKFFSENDLASNNHTLSKNHGLLYPDILQEMSHIYVWANTGNMGVLVAAG